MADLENNITSANATITISSALGNFDLDKFSTDSELTGESVEIVETRIGVDGQISAGYVPTIKHITIDFEASSKSIPHLMDLAQLAETSKTPQPVILTLTLPSVKKRFIFNGFLKNVPATYLVQRTLQPLQFGFDVSTPVILPL